MTRSWLLRFWRPGGYGLRRSRSTRGRSWVPASPPVVDGLCVTYRPHPSGRPSSLLRAGKRQPPWEGGGALACRGRNGRPSVADRPTLDNNSRNWQLDRDRRSQPGHEAWRRQTIDRGRDYHGRMSGKVLLAAPRGYCAGVDRAVDAVERALAKHGAPVYVRKQIVHNLHVVRDLESKGAVFVEEETEVPEGAVVVLSAHGVAPEVYSNSRVRGLEVIDATCPLVTKVHMEARRFAAGRPHDRADRPRGTRGGRGHDRARRPSGRSWSRAPTRPARSQSTTPTTSPTSRRPPCRSTRRTRSSTSSGSGSPRSRDRRATTSATPRRTARTR